MSKKEKLRQRLFLKPKDFTYDEAKSLLIGLGCKEYTRGKTSGSAMRFYHEESKKVFYLDKPHPENILKNYIINGLIRFIKEVENI